jgi:solute carrier family 25 carnitine/acylcarnitine transporter 20/29
VGSAKIVEADIYASNGVLHLVDDLLIPDGALKLTLEKYLLALNCTKLVSLIHSVNATYLINGTTSNETRTILAMSDDVLSQNTGDDLPEPGSDDLKRLLEYHFLPERWTPNILKDGMLLRTELREKGLNGSQQVLPVEVELSKKAKKDSDLDSVRFGGTSTLRRGNLI